MNSTLIISESQKEKILSLYYPSGLREQFEGWSTPNPYEMESRAYGNQAMMVKHAIDAGLDNAAHMWHELTQLEWKDWKHIILEVAELSSLLLPPPFGLALSSGFALWNAYEYYKDGDKKSATLYVIFAAIPLGGKLSKKLFKGLSTTSKIIFRQKSTANNKWINKYLQTSPGPARKALEKNTEDAVIRAANELENALHKNVTTKEVARQLGAEVAEETVKKELSQAAKSKLAKELAKKQAKTSLDKLLLKALKSPTTQSLAVAGGAVVGHDQAYDKIALSGKLGPKEYLKATGKYTAEDLPILQSIFNGTPDITSKGFSKSDNQKLVNAMIAGWEPGEVLPEKYQTQTLKKLFAHQVQERDEMENLLTSILERDTQVLPEFTVLDKSLRLLVEVLKEQVDDNETTTALTSRIDQLYSSTLDDKEKEKYDVEKEKHELSLKQQKQSGGICGGLEKWFSDKQQYWRTQICNLVRETPQAEKINNVLTKIFNKKNTTIEGGQGGIDKTEVKFGNGIKYPASLITGMVGAILMGKIDKDVFIKKLPTYLANLSNIKTLLQQAFEGYKPPINKTPTKDAVKLNSPKSNKKK